MGAVRYATVMELDIAVTFEGLAFSADVRLATCEILCIQRCVQGKSKTKGERGREGGVSVGVENEASWESLSLVSSRRHTRSILGRKRIECS